MTMSLLGVTAKIGPEHVYDRLDDARAAFRAA
jgi:hypothetical protein